MQFTGNIRHYSDYREFLKAYYEAKKLHNPSFSYGVWSRSMALTGASSLTKIVAGEREAGPEIVEKLMTYFNFDSNDRSYFLDLLRLNRVKDDSRLKVIVLERMAKVHPEAKERIIDDKSFAIISNWFCLTIREMIKLRDFKEDPAWIQSRLLYQVSAEDIRRAIDDLLAQGLLRRNLENKLIYADGILKTSDDVSSEAIKQYHEQMLDNAKAALRNVSVEKREFTSVTYTISEDKVSDAKELIKEFKKNFNRLLEEPLGSQTYQFQVQFFPLTN